MKQKVACWQNLQHKIASFKKAWLLPASWNKLDALHWGDMIPP